MNEHSPHDPRDENPSPTIDLLKQIQQGSRNPTSLTTQERRRLVELLIYDGYSIAQVAHILKVSERTVYRDKQAIHKEHALEHDPQLSGLMAGRIVTEAEHAMQRIRQAARDKNVPAHVRIDAEHRAFQIATDTVRTLQSMGFVASAAHKIEAQVHHHGQPPELEQIECEVTRLKKIAGDGEPAREVQDLEDQLLRAKLDRKARQIIDQPAMGQEGASDAGT